jgi:hypothetical protein
MDKKKKTKKAKSIRPRRTVNGLTAVETRLMMALIDPINMTKQVTQICEMIGMKQSYYYQVIRRPHFIKRCREEMDFMKTHDPRYMQMWNRLYEKSRVAKKPAPYFKLIMQAHGDLQEKHVIKDETSNKEKIDEYLKSIEQAQKLKEEKIDGKQTSQE